MSAHVWVVESRTGGVRRGVFTEWEPWLPYAKKADALATLNQQIVAHAVCCNPPREFFRIRKYTRESKP